MNTTIQQHQQELNVIDIPYTASTTVQSNIMTAPFLHHVFLISLNLVVNAKFHFLVCQLCEEAIPMLMTQGHIINKHSELIYVLYQEQYNSIARELLLAPTLPTGISGPRVIVHSLAMHNALTCAHCPTVFTKVNDMRDHHL
jgi:hypothetical protein